MKTKKQIIHKCYNCKKEITNVTNLNFNEYGEILCNNCFHNNTSTTDSELT
jgi:DNA-directed RNA polymerase subunit RPC12/RpoP